MKIVLLFFCAILGIILLTFILLVLSTVRINIVKARISNFENGIKKKKLEKEFVIYLELCLFGKLRLVRIKLRKNIFNKVKNKANMEEIQKDAKILKNKHVKELIDKLKIKVSRLNFEIEFGTEEMMVTVFLVAFISSIISILIRNCNYKKVHYNIMPLYQFGNTIKFNLNCIIEVKVVHIIYVIYILLKKGMIKNERASNRRSYDYSYE